MRTYVRMTPAQLTQITALLAEQLHRDAAPGEPKVPWSALQPHDPIAAGHTRTAERSVQALHKLGLLREP